jgi:hypothetical protein
VNALCVSALLLAPAVHAAVRAYTALHRLHALSLTTDNSIQCVTPSPLSRSSAFFILVDARALLRIPSLRPRLQCQVSLIREDQRHEREDRRLGLRAPERRASCCMLEVTLTRLFLCVRL